MQGEVQPSREEQVGAVVTTVVMLVLGGALAIAGVIWTVHVLSTSGSLIADVIILGFSYLVFSVALWVVALLAKSVALTAMVATAAARWVNSHRKTA